MAIKLLHFADAHIDMVNYGRHDAVTGLPTRVLDFLKSLDTIIDTAINEKVDLVLFAGDAYKDRTPAPTFQREWGRRIMRLSRAGIPTLLLVGNHDISPALGRASSIQEFDTLSVPHVRVLSRPSFLSPAELENLPLQLIALPWLPRAGLLAALNVSSSDPAEVYESMQARLIELVTNWLEQADPRLPVILTAHASVEGAVFGGERTVMLGSELTLPGAMVRNPQLDYVALGHIHKSQNLNEGGHPPVIYPGSIERVDFGEVDDDKGFIIATVERGRTQVAWRKLAGVRPFIDRYVHLESDRGVTEHLLAALPDPERLIDAVVRLTIDYPRQWEALIDDAALRQYASNTFEFVLIKRPQVEARIRLPENKAMSSYTPLELLNKYWETAHVSPDESEELQKLADEIIHSTD